MCASWPRACGDSGGMRNLGTGALIRPALGPQGEALVAPAPGWQLCCAVLRCDPWPVRRAPLPCASSPTVHSECGRRAQACGALAQSAGGQHRGFLCSRRVHEVSTELFRACADCGRAAQSFSMIAQPEGGRHKDLPCSRRVREAAAKNLGARREFARAGKLSSSFPSSIPQAA